MRTRHTNAGRMMCAARRMPCAIIAALALCIICPQAFGAKLYQPLNMVGNAITNAATPVYATSPASQAATKKYVDDVTVAGSAQFTVLTNVLKVNGVAGPAGATGATGPCAGVSGQLIYNNAGAAGGTLVKYGSSTITNVPTPVNADHAANKAYVDALTSLVQQLQQQQLLIDEMTLIPAGYFQMGSNAFADGLGNDPSDASPNHQVFISSFYMDKTEVTWTQYTNVRTWAISHGYTDLAAGSGKATNHPVQTVSWYDCLKWCNARSEMKGLTPCYYTNAAQTMVYHTGTVDVQNVWVKWTVNGYRLPTEAEWEKAARGGAVGMRFPWADANTITNSRANYRGDTGYAYDLGPNGYNPLFTPGGAPYTSPAGYFAPNGYGLYDMAGNVWEWCWDLYGSTYYGISPASDPRGPVSGSLRVTRGGVWGDIAGVCRSAARGNVVPNYTGYGVGFRCARGL